MNSLLQLLVSTLAVLVASYLLPEVKVDNFLTAIIVAGVLGMLNVFLKPILVLFSLPAVIFSLGLFLIVINTFIILLTDKLIPGFEIAGLGSAFLFSLVMWAVNGILNTLRKNHEEVQ